MHAPSSSRPPSRTGKATFKENALSDAECELLERHFPNEYSCGMQTVRAMLRALGRSECVGRAWRDDDDFKRVSSHQSRRQQKAKAAGAIIADGRKTRSKGDEAEVALATLSVTGLASVGSRVCVWYVEQLGGVTATVPYRGSVVSTHQHGMDVAFDGDASPWAVTDEDEWEFLAEDEEEVDEQGAGGWLPQDEGFGAVSGDDLGGVFLVPDDEYVLVPTNEEARNPAAQMQIPVVG